MKFDPACLDKFPELPGVYLMKDKHGQVIYVGKAKSLKHRVKQYFIGGRDERPQVPYLARSVRTIDIIVVASEKEALLLENTLIKQHDPKYNICLKDDKTYTSIKVTGSRWPSMRLVRFKGRPQGGAHYFGPYASVLAARQTFEALKKLFPLRQCSDREFASRQRPCLLYQIKRCLGPCAAMCSHEDYSKVVQRTIKFLKGQDREVLKELRQEMREAAELLEYERAAELLRLIEAMEKTIEEQHVHRIGAGDEDAIGLYREGDEVMVAKLIVRGGKVLGIENFAFSQVVQEDEEVVRSFILQHYAGGENLPGVLLVPLRLGDRVLVEEIVSGTGKCRLHCPQRGSRKSLVDMAARNAAAAFRRRQDDGARMEKVLLDLQEKLRLGRYPRRIECFDTSGLSGSDMVAALVCFTDGLPEKKRYRRFVVRTTRDDDYAAMREVLARRLKRVRGDDDLPDLIVVDGGKGQLGMALQALEEASIASVDVIGLAKEAGRHDKGMTGERVFLPSARDSVLLRANSPTLFLLQRIRDEAHRFALTYHRQKRSKRYRENILDAVPGIGPVKKKALMKRFGSAAALSKATRKDLEGVGKLTKGDIESLLLRFGQDK